MPFIIYYAHISLLISMIYILIAFDKPRAVDKFLASFRASRAYKSFIILSFSSQLRLLLQHNARRRLPDILNLVKRKLLLHVSSLKLSITGAAHTFPRAFARFTTQYSRHFTIDIRYYSHEAL